MLKLGPLTGRQSQRRLVVRLSRQQEALSADALTPVFSPSCDVTVNEDTSLKALEDEDPD